MHTNDVQAFINQQMGIMTWKHSFTLLKRLKCEKTFSDFSSLPCISETPIFTCKFCPMENNEHLLALANEDGNLAVHNSINEARLNVHAHNNAIFDLAWMFNKMKLVTASGDHTSKMYDVGQSEIVQERTFCGHTRSVKTIAFRKEDANVFATGGRDGNIILWDARTQNSSFIDRADDIISNSHVTKNFTPTKSRKKFNTPTSSGIKSVTGLVFQEDNTLISCGAGDGVIKIWDLRKHYTRYYKMACPKTTIPHPGITTKNGYSSLIMDNAGTRLYASCLDNIIYTYNSGTYNYEPIMKYGGHLNSSFYVKSCLSSDGKYLLSGSSNESAYIWDTKLPEPILKLTGHTAEVTCVAWCARNMLLVTCSDDMSYKIWNVGSEEPPDSEQGDNRNKVEILPISYKVNKLKRRAQTQLSFTPKKVFTECQKCNNATSSKFCENCGKNFSKRKNSFELESANKITCTDFGPRRLFANMNNPVQVEKGEFLAYRLEAEDSADEYECPRKIAKLAEETFPHSGTDYAMKLAKLEITPITENMSSPTTNLPNYVLDGIAPHLSYSPPKKKCQDWLTRLRIQTSLRRDYEKSDTSPKPTRNDTPLRKKDITPKSPILRYFKVTNSPHKCDSGCAKHQQINPNLDTK